MLDPNHGEREENQILCYFSTSNRERERGRERVIVDIIKETVAWRLSPLLYAGFIFRTFLCKEREKEFYVVNVYNEKTRETR